MARAEAKSAIGRAERMGRFMVSPVEKLAWAEGSTIEGSASWAVIGRRGVGFPVGGRFIVVVIMAVKRWVIGRDRNAEE